MSYPQGENSSYQGYQQAPAPHGGGFTAPQQPHQDAQTIYGQGQNSGAWHHGEFDEATEYASRETGNDKSMFSSLLSSVLSGQPQHEQAQPHEIEQARAAHQNVYGGGSRGNQPVHDDDVASAAAMQAVERSGSSGSGSLQSVIGMAMSEVTKLMGKQSGGSTGAQQGSSSSSGGQSAMIQKAVSMAIKLYASKQAGSAAGQAAGGGSSNPLESMMGMFMGGGSKPSSSQSGGYSQSPSHQSNASGYAPPPSHQGAASNYSNAPPNQGQSGYSQPPQYNEPHQQAPYGQQQGYSHSQQQAPYGQQQDYNHQQQQAPYGQQQQQQGEYIGTSGSCIERPLYYLSLSFLLR
ncbi:hypothetical protein K450DRAFT_220381 [Umbelopsis ramanniana AG]|uniref:DUF7721 domain-containing protein n=1 Tax=Umbelopsis ramanniana AG TaxID=1314678 RepID=A0AAD5HJ21_UMBRA|nr:uncharacterized protein K450DRAFT_220381 [Umbelopsis ramanniana AG]KAI8583878.1 hypothetical protein K450DRAFT_220381 [Umbelopsis ramanniana AG]